MPVLDLARRPEVNQRSRFSVLTKRSAASRDENDAQRFKCSENCPLSDRIAIDGLLPIIGFLLKLLDRGMIFKII